MKWSVKWNGREIRDPFAKVALTIIMFSILYAGICILALPFYLIVL